MKHAKAKLSSLSALIIIASFLFWNERTKRSVRGHEKSCRCVAMYPGAYVRPEISLAGPLPSLGECCLWKWTAESGRPTCGKGGGLVAGIVVDLSKPFSECGDLEGTAYTLRRRPGLPELCHPLKVESVGLTGQMAVTELNLSPIQNVVLTRCRKSGAE